MTATAVILAPGEVLGGFRIADVVGVGGMGVVYRARQISLGREVALKVLSPELASDETFSERFRAEGMHAARLDHPNVIPVYDAGEDGGRLYLAMRLVDGMSLAERLRVNPPTASEALDILRPIASGLDAAHAIGLVHRDVKPQNILLTDAGHPYLADFGVAKGAESAGLTASGGFVGTLNYAAPEQILGLPTVAATDVYALAAVLYHCVTGTVPYPRETQAGLMFAQVNQPPPHLPLPEAVGFNGVIGRGMAKDPEDRFASAGELMAAAEEVLQALPAPYPKRRPAFAPHPSDPTWTSPEEPRTTNRSPRFWLSRPLVLLTTALVAGAAAAGVIAFLAGGVAAAPKRVARSPSLAIRYSPPWRLARGVFAASALQARTATGAPNRIELRDGLASLAAGVLTRSPAVPGAPPPELVSRFGRPIPADWRASRGEAVAVYHWTVSGVQDMSVLVIPTAAGDLAVICSAPVGLSDALQGCEALARRVRASAESRLPVGPDEGLARSVNRIVTTAAAGRGGTAHMFRGRSNDQTSVPVRLAAADLRASEALQHLKVPPRYRLAVSGLASGLSAEAASLTALGRAIRTHNHRRYEGAAHTLRGLKLEGLTRALRNDQLLAAGLSPLVLPTLPLQVSSVASIGSAGGASTSSTTSTVSSPAVSSPSVVSTPGYNPPTYSPSASAAQGSSSSGTSSSGVGSSQPIR